MDCHGRGKFARGKRLEVNLFYISFRAQSENFIYSQIERKRGKIHLRNKNVVEVSLNVLKFLKNQLKRKGNVY